MEVQKIKITNQPYLKKFVTLIMNGSDDQNISGEHLEQIIDRTGKMFIPIRNQSDWVSIGEGIKFLRESYSIGSMRTIEESIRIEPNACPVTLVIEKRNSYSSSNPEFDKTSFSSYRVLIES